MIKKDLIKILSELLGPCGFKRKGNYWVLDDTKIVKMVNLQKSQFSNLFYINYCYIIKSIPIDGLSSHIENRAWTNNNEPSKDILNLENGLSDAVRKTELEKIINIVISKLQSVNSEAQLLEYIKTLPTLNIVPLRVKKYFDLI